MITDSYNEKKCIDNCIEKHLQSLECIPNPFINESFVLINSNQNSIKVCEKLQNISIDIKHCYKKCPKNCLQIYNKLNIKTSIDNYDGNSYLKIVNERTKKFSYQAGSQLKIIEYFANMGGLFGLYLGISLIEMGKFIKYSILITKNFLNYLTNIKILRMIKFKKWLQKFNFLLDNIDKINFTLISKLLINPVLMYELLSMVNLYFQYSTQTNYEFKFYNISDNKYSINEFPSITVCTEQLFEKVWFEDYYDFDTVIKSHFNDLSKKTFSLEKKTQKICKNSLSYLNYIQTNITNYHVKFPMIYYVFRNLHYYDYTLEEKSWQTETFDKLSFHHLEMKMFCNKSIPMLQFIIDKLLSNNYSEFDNKMLQFEDKYSHGLSPLKQMFDFYGQHYSCQTNKPSIDCSQINPTKSLLSPSGKCQTFLSNRDSILSHIKNIDININVFIDTSLRTYIFPHYLIHRILIQDESHLPSYKSIEIIPVSNYKFRQDLMAIELKKTVIKRLEKPYDTKCHDYGKSNQIDCLNKCFLKKYLEKFNCLPNQNKFHSLVLDFSEDKLLFCPDEFSINLTQFETSIQSYCNHICGDPCVETLYQANIADQEDYIQEMRLKLYFQDKTYPTIEYSPKITMTEFFINMFNIWNLWHGTSLISVIGILTKFSKILIRLFGWSFNIWNKKILINIIMMSLSLIFAGKILSHTMEYFQFETKTKINLIDYANDDKTILIYQSYSYIIFPIFHFILSKINSISLQSNQTNLLITKLMNSIQKL